MGFPRKSINAAEHKGTVIDARETYRVKLMIIAARITAKRKTSGAMARRTPSPVDAPRPPLNFRNIENMCPSIAAMPVNTISKGSPNTIIARYTARAPLSKSRAKTMAAGRIPIARRTLVAPTLPLPTFVMSIL